MFRTAMTALLLLAACATAVHGQGTAWEREACRRDVVRLCKGVAPETIPMLDCLKEHRGRLSRACRYVLESHGQ